MFLMVLQKKVFILEYFLLNWLCSMVSRQNNCILLLLLLVHIWNASIPFVKVIFFVIERNLHLPMSRFSVFWPLSLSHKRWKVCMIKNWIISQELPHTKGFHHIKYYFKKKTRVGFKLKCLSNIWFFRLLMAQYSELLRVNNLKCMHGYAVQKFAGSTWPTWKSTPMYWRRFMRQIFR